MIWANTLMRTDGHKDTQMRCVQTECWCAITRCAERASLRKLRVAETGAHGEPNAPGPRGSGKVRDADNWALQGQPTMRKRLDEVET
jgi:hypothetical protein